MMKNSTPINLRTRVVTSIIMVCFLACGPKQEKADGKNSVSDKDSTSIYPKPIKLTAGPGQHWFGYYDKLQIDPTGRYVLGAQVDTILRSPTSADTLKIGMVDLLDGNKWIELGTSNAWGWQQGCMLQWIPGSDYEIIWNDIQNGKFVSHVLNIKTKEKRTLPKAIYTLSNDGTFALGTEFNRIQNLRPGYGYPGTEDPFEENKHPSEIGIYKMDLQTGESQLLISIDEMAAQENQGEDLTAHWHWFNHILVSPDDRRFVFLHRWRKELGNRADRASSGFITRMVTVNIDGSDKYILDPSGHTSHFIWKSPKELCMWTKPLDKDWGFYLFKDKTEKIEPVGEGIMTQNGHNTYVPNTNNEWILNDTYPQGDGRLQELYLYHVPTKRKVVLGKFHEPKKYTKEWRNDLHPKASRDGKWVIFDSTHGGDGRQMYMIKIDTIVQNRID